MDKYSHLHEHAIDKLHDMPEERIEYIQTDWWIGYDEAKGILKELDDLINHPRNLRMPCRALIGDSQNGKSTLLRRCFVHNEVKYTEDEQIIFPAIIFETPSEASEGRLYSNMLNALGVAHREDAAPVRLLAKVIDRMTTLNVRLLMADEFHNMLQDTPRNQRQFLASLKSLLNMLKLPFVAAGTQDVARALATDTQFVSRFEQLTLPRWGANETTLRMIGTMERLLPLPEPSGLTTQEKAVHIIGASGGTLGGVVDVVKKAGIAAILKGRNSIDLPILDEVIKKRNERKIK